MFNYERDPEDLNRMELEDRDRNDPYNKYKIYHREKEYHYG